MHMFNTMLSKLQESQLIDATKWPEIPQPRPGEVIVSAPDLTSDETFYIQSVSSQCADYVNDLKAETPDDEFVEIVSSVYHQANLLIQEKTGIRVDFQFKISPELFKLEVRCFSFRRVH